jgi:hypothetical protein
MHESGFPWQVNCPPKVTWHTTEGFGVPNYPSQYEPHLTVVAVAGKDVQVYQHIALDRAAYALKHAAGMAPTNGAHAIQIELAGTCDPSGPKGAYYWPNADDAVLRALWVKVAKPLTDGLGVPLVAPPFKAYPASYGGNGVRFTDAQWLAWHGHCGHMHIPGNDHGDPGAFPWDRMVRLAGAAPKPPAPLAAADVRGPVKYGDRGPYVRVIQHRLDQQLGVKVAIDGVFGRSTLIAVQDWQKKHRLTADGVIGAKTAASMGFTYAAK